MSDDSFSTAQSPCPPIAPAAPNTTIRQAPALTFDPEEYRHFLADCDWTDAQKDEFTEALWGIVLNFVDLGFDLNPVQKVIDIKGLELDSPNVISSETISYNTDTTEAKFVLERAAREIDS
ncbi:MAG: hypothetical protein QOJ96_457 [Alphaproteobacteria bacterium]|jgi:hypothetical protein|nr:hypothetical protein [Alphaproteobacteria bacterium]